MNFGSQPQIPQQVMELLISGEEMEVHYSLTLLQLMQQL